MLLTVGRDKVLRTLQYFSRFYAWYLYRTNNPPAAIAPFNAIKTQFGVTRKIMRVGKFVEHFKAAAELYDASAKIRANGGDQVLQYRSRCGWHTKVDQRKEPPAAGL